ncbi:hypothetical protein [Longimicrobium sp.]|uniref:hypothetical protein n=1 Tax=Longimicrobium sp. TaxID=2029185 RepID=UPI002C1A821E|nr:hypothetical protein [Longimicrobium sp.]HSU16979.1 hypothetical protein [Longimicrobium sp.]
MSTSLAQLTPVMVAVIGLAGSVTVKVVEHRLARAEAPDALGRRRRTAKSPRAGILFYICLGMLVGGVAGAALPRLIRRTAPELRITHPADGGRAAIQETIRGTSRNLPPGDSVWVVVYIPSTARYYPQDRPADVQAGGGWNALARLGVEQDAGRRFEVLAVAADAATRAAFAAYLAEGARRRSWPGLERLPATAREHDRVAVTRLP